MKASAPSDLALPAPPQSFLYGERRSRSPGLEAVWSLRVLGASIEPLPYIVLPDGCLDLVFHARREVDGRIESAALMVVAPAERVDTVLVRPGDLFTGLRFSPGWGAMCLGVPAVELAGDMRQAQEVSAELKTLGEHLALTRSTAHAAWLLARAGRHWALSRSPTLRAMAALQSLKSGCGQQPLPPAARSRGMSARTLRREIGECVGIAPKSLARIFRFRRALHLQREGTLSLALLAHEAGFSDQAHMTREFRALGGFTPSRLPASLTF